MTNRVGVIVEPKQIQVVILGSNTLGPSSLPDQGFEWAKELTLETLVPIIAKIEIMETRWGEWIRQWQKEGAMGDEVEITPGLIAWLVSIDVTNLGGCRVEEVFGRLAKRLTSQAPHVTFEFVDGSFDARTLAAEAIDILRQTTPIRYRAPSISRSMHIATVA